MSSTDGVLAEGDKTERDTSNDAPSEKNPEGCSSKFKTCFREWLILPKLLYFIFIGGNAFVIPFLPVFYKSWNFSSQEIGVLSSLTPFLLFIASTLWTMLADATGRHRLILLVAMSITTILLVAMVVVPHLFPVIFALVFAYSLTRAPSFPLLDTWTLSQLGGDKAAYGRQRLWGAVAWGLVTTLSGFIMDAGLTWLLFVLHGLFLLTYLILIRTMTAESWASVTPQRQEQQRVPFFTRVRRLLANIRLVVFLGHSFVMGAASAVIGSFLFLYLTEHLGASSTLLGLTLLVSCCGEAPFFFMAKRVQEKIGIRGMVAAAHIGYIARVLWYSFVTNPWAVLPAEILHALTFAAMWAAGIAYAAEIAPPGLEATGQGLFTGVYSGIGSGTGALLGGVVYSTFGPRVLFQGTACVVAFDLVVFTVIQFVFARIDRRAGKTATAASPSASGDVSESGVHDMELHVYGGLDDEPPHEHDIVTTEADRRVSIEAA